MGGTVMSDTTLLYSYTLEHPPWRAEMARETAMNTVSSTITNMPWDTIIYDPNGNCVTGVNAAYTCPADGYYAVSATVVYAGSAANQFGVLYLYNSPIAGGGYAAVAAGPQEWSGASGGMSATLGIAGSPCFAGDQLEVRYDIGGVFAVTVSASLAWVQFAWTGPK